MYFLTIYNSISPCDNTGEYSPVAAGRRNVPHRADTQRQPGPEELRGAGEGVGRGGEIEPYQESRSTIVIMQSPGYRSTLDLRISVRSKPVLCLSSYPRLYLA